VSLKFCPTQESYQEGFLVLARDISFILLSIPVLYLVVSLKAGTIPSDQGGEDSEAVAGVLLSPSSAVAVIFLRLVQQFSAHVSETVFP
jgi:hypothetical protein